MSATIIATTRHNTDTVAYKIENSKVIPLHVDESGLNVGDTVAILVTSAYSDYGEHLVGRIAQVTVTEFPLTRIEYMLQGACLYGQPINPTPEDGGYYQLFDYQLGSPSAIVEYVDNVHTNRRHREGHAWNLVASGDGSPWVIDNDSMESITHEYFYVKVEKPEWLDVPPAEAEPEPAAEPAANVVDNAGTGVTFGKAVVEDNGMVLLDPVISAGQPYLYWEDEHCTKLAWAWDSNGRMQLTLVARMVRSEQSGEMMFTPMTGTTYVDPAMDGGHWAKALFAEPPATEHDEGNLDRLVQILSDKRNRFEEFNDALNDKAEEEDWCEEYERVMNRLDMRGRENKTADYRFEIEVSYRASGSTSHSEDQKLSSVFGLDVVIDTIEFTGKSTVTITRYEISDPGIVGVYDFDRSEIEEALGNELCVVDVDEVIEWTVEGYEESDG